MKKTNTSLLLHPLFLFSLLLLIANDFYGKLHHPGWLTGKLSDIAGIIVLPVFLLTVFPARRKPILLFSALFFTWWKSPLSQPVINACNELFSLPVNRVVDYTDLLVLPLLFYVHTMQPVRVPYHAMLQRCLQTGVAAVALLSLCATTVAPYRYGLYTGLRENEVPFSESFSLEKTEDQILADWERKGIELEKKSSRYYPVVAQNDLFYRISGGDSLIRWSPVPYTTDSVIHLRHQTTPFYVLPLAVLDGDTLKQIEFSIQADNKKKKSTIRIASFRTNQPERYRNLYSGKQRKKIKKQFEELFSN